MLPAHAGWSLGHIQKPRDDVVLPAHAGMAPCMCWWCCRPASAPRARGDGPASGLVCSSGAYLLFAYAGVAQVELDCLRPDCSLRMRG